MDYCCNKCGQQFKWKQSLERHLMDHTGIRPHPCEQCKLTFKTSNSLKKHKLSVHSDIKHFVCQHCGSRFSTSSGVLRHQKKQRCSAMKQGLTNNAIKTESTVLPKSHLELLEPNSSQSKQEKIPETSQDTPKGYSSQVKSNITEEDQRKSNDALHYSGVSHKDGFHKIRPELLQYLGAQVKQEHTLQDSGDLSGSGVKVSHSERAIQGLQTMQYIQGVHIHGQPLTLAIPRQQVIMGASTDRQNNSQLNHQHVEYRLNIAE